MTEFVQLCLSFPTLIFSLLVTVALGYWIVVTISGLDVDGPIALEFGGDTAMGDVTPGQDDGGGSQTSVASALDLLSWLRIRRAPASVVLSIWALIAWTACILMVRPVSALLSAMLPSLLVSGTVALTAALLAVPLAVAISSPLGAFFVVHQASVGNHAWIGKSVVVKTTFVDERSGQGLLDLGADTHLLAIRAFAADELRKGDHVLLVAFESETNSFRVRRLDDHARNRIEHLG